MEAPGLFCSSERVATALRFRAAFDGTCRQLPPLARQATVEGHGGPSLNLSNSQPQGISAMPTKG